MPDGTIEATFYQCLGKHIEAKRRQRGLSQSDLGSLIGVHRNTIMRWESGESAIYLWDLLRLADALSCNHLLLLPPREFTWGPDLYRLVRERDPIAVMRKPIQSERDREVYAREAAHG